LKKIVRGTPYRWGVR